LAVSTGNPFEPHCSLQYSPAPTQRELDRLRYIFDCILLGARAARVAVIEHDDEPASSYPETEPLDAADFLDVLRSAAPDVSNVLRLGLHAVFPPEASTGESSHFVNVLARAEAWLSYSPDEKARVYELLKELVREIIYCFLVPLCACGARTPSITPSVFSPSERFSAYAGQGTEDRLKNLRKLIIRSFVAVLGRHPPSIKSHFET
jgi:rRNA maturation protein Nop10